MRILDKLHASKSDTESENPVDHRLWHSERRGNFYLHVGQARRIGVDVIGDGFHGEEGEVWGQMKDRALIDLLQNARQVSLHGGAHRLVPLIVETEALQEIENGFHQTGALSIKNRRIILRPVRVLLDSDRVKVAFTEGM